MLANGGQNAPTPGPKNVANWQTQFFFGRSFHGRLLLRRRQSLPTVANSGGKWQTRWCEAFHAMRRRRIWGLAPDDGGQAALAAIRE